MGKSKQLLITLSPSQAIYVSIMKEYLRIRSNQKFLLELMRLGEKALERGSYLGEAPLGKLILSLGINPKGKRYFKAHLDLEQYAYFWYLGERLELSIKREIFLGLIFLTEKLLSYTIQEAINRVIAIVIKDQDKRKVKEGKK